MRGDVAARDLPRDEGVDLLRKRLLVGGGLADDRGGVRLAALQGGVAGLLLLESLRDRLLEPGQLGLGLLEVEEALVERPFLSGRLLAQLVGLDPRVRDRLVDRGQRLLVHGDLVGQGLVLLADVDVVAHLGEELGEGAAGQERLQRRGAVRVVGAAYPVGEEGPALAELDALGLFLGRHARKLDVHVADLEDEVGVGVLDELDPRFHLADLLLDRGQVGTDGAELAAGVADLGGETRLQVVEGRDPGLLRRDFLLESGLTGLGVGQVVATCGLGRDGGAKQAEDERDQEHERRQAATRATSGAVQGLAGPAAGSDVARFRADRAADHLGDVIVRANSVGGALAGAVARVDGKPAGAVVR